MVLLLNVWEIDFNGVSIDLVYIVKSWTHHTLEMMNTHAHYWLLDMASLRHQPQAWRITDISDLPAAGDVGTATEWCAWSSLLKTLLLRGCCPRMLPSAPQPSIKPWGLLIGLCYLRLQAKLKCSLWKCLEVCLHKCNFRKVAWDHMCLVTCLCH